MLFCCCHACIGHRVTVQGIGHMVTVQGIGHRATVQGIGHGVTVQGIGHGVTVQGIGHRVTVQGIGHRPLMWRPLALFPACAPFVAGSAESCAGSHAASTLRGTGPTWKRGAASAKPAMAVGTTASSASQRVETLPSHTGSGPPGGSASTDVLSARAKQVCSVCTFSLAHIFTCAHACVRACVRLRACVRACMRACMKSCSLNSSLCIELMSFY